MPPKKVLKDKKIKSKNQNPAAPVNLGMSKIEKTCQNILQWIAVSVAATLGAICPEVHPRGRLVVGSACSGISSELMALDMLGVKYTPCFACESQKHLRVLSQEMHGYCHMYVDVCSDQFLSSPTCDLFVSGFPCQPFSAAGLGRGISDKTSGKIMISLARWIAVHKPRAFVLENVQGLVQRHPRTLLTLMTVLQGLHDHRGSQLYNVSWKILHCAKHGYLPQNRSRLFIVGLRSDSQVSPMTWPTEAGSMAMLVRFVQWHDCFQPPSCRRQHQPFE